MGDVEVGDVGGEVPAGELGPVVGQYAAEGDADAVEDVDDVVDETGRVGCGVLAES